MCSAKDGQVRVQFGARRCRWVGWNGRMPGMEYRAFSNQGFLFQETVRVARLFVQGHNADQVRRLALEEDLFELRSLQSRKTMVNAVLERFDGLSCETVSQLVAASPDTQRALVLLLIAKRHRLLAETLLELNRWSVTVSSVTLAAFRGFFQRSRADDLTLSGWSDETFQKSVGNVLKYLREARLIVPLAADLEIRAPLLSDADRGVIREAFGAWGLRALLQPGQVPG
jgi:Putative inner membrane protein (DUF1819)